MPAAPAPIPSTAELTREAELPPERSGQPRAYRVSTRMWLVLSGVTLGLIGAGSLGVIAAFAFIVVLPASLIALMRDGRLEAVRDRRTAERAVACYFRAIRYRRWDLAHAALAPVARRAPVEVPRIRELRSHARRVTRSTPAGVGAYWREFAASSEGLIRRVIEVHYRPVERTDTTCRFRVSLAVRCFPSWAVVVALALGPLSLPIIAWTRRTYRTAFDVTVFKHRSQWWLLDGEMGTAEQGTAHVAALPTARAVRR